VGKERLAIPTIKFLLRVIEIYILDINKIPKVAMVNHTPPLKKFCMTKSSFRL